MSNGIESGGLGDDLVIERSKRGSWTGAGTSVSGSVAGHAFQALVFPEHAMNAEWEIGDSRISKLWVRRIADRVVVYNWDRGQDIPAADAEAQQVVDFLCAGLAEHTYGH